MPSLNPVNSRIKRLNKPARKFTENTYRKSLPYLLKDFGGRCAYSLEHVEEISERQMTIDHHNPILKHPARNKYENLYPATNFCNNFKSNRWPAFFEREKGKRFLDPCREQDYGAQIFEDPVSFRLTGTTPAAIYHIGATGLNAQYLINKRKRRAQLKSAIDELKLMRVDPTQKVILDSKIAELEKILELLIPAIPSNRCS